MAKSSRVHPASCSANSISPVYPVRKIGQVGRNTATTRNWGTLLMRWPRGHQPSRSATSLISSKSAWKYLRDRERRSRGSVPVRRVHVTAVLRWASLGAAAGTVSIQARRCMATWSGRRRFWLCKEHICRRRWSMARRRHRTCSRWRRVPSEGENSLRPSEAVYRSAASWPGSGMTPSWQTDTTVEPCASTRSQQGSWTRSAPEGADRKAADVHSSAPCSAKSQLPAARQLLRHPRSKCGIRLAVELRCPSRLRRGQRNQRRR